MILLIASRAAKHFTVSRMQLVEIIYEVIREVPDQRHDVLLAVPWKALVNWFFEHKWVGAVFSTVKKA